MGSQAFCAIEKKKKRKRDQKSEKGVPSLWLRVYVNFFFSGEIFEIRDVKKRPFFEKHQAKLVKRPKKKTPKKGES